MCTDRYDCPEAHNHHPHHPHKLRGNAELRTDPTRSKTLRNAFERQFNKRWNRVLKRFRQFMEEAPDVVVNYDFPTGPLQATQLLDFLNTTVREEVIDPVEARRIVREKGVTPDPQDWVAQYIYDAYKKGVRRAETEINKRKKGAKVDLVKGAIKRQNHQDKLEQVLTRTYTALEGINEAMEAGIRREIALGLENGEGTQAIARRIEKRVEKIGKTRSRVLARTEVIRSHHAANMALYREAGVKGVQVRAEFSTSADQRVCKQCEGLEGQVFALSEMEDLIPLHPNCRCVALPIVDN